jgi:hypothetical protein
MPLTDPKLHPLAVLGKAPEPCGCLKGYCNTTYDSLVALLGQPHTHRGDKTTVVWAVRCNDGTTFHVYDWKLPSTPKGPYDWHIGGSSSSALVAFHRFTGLPVTPLDVESYQVAYVWNPNSIFPSDAHQQSNSTQAQDQSA